MRPMCLGATKSLSWGLDQRGVLAYQPSALRRATTRTQMSDDAVNLGGKYTCFKCSCIFYDLGRPQPLCPRCGADQREDPDPDPRTAFLSRYRRMRRGGSSKAAAKQAEEAQAARAESALETAKEVAPKAKKGEEDLLD